MNENLIASRFSADDRVHICLPGLNVHTSNNCTSLDQIGSIGSIGNNRRVGVPSFCNVYIRFPRGCLFQVGLYVRGGSMVLKFTHPGEGLKTMEGSNSNYILWITQ